MAGPKLKDLRNEKTKTTDEFLLKKTASFFTSDFDKLPKPGVNNEKQKKNDINKILQIQRVTV